MTNGIRESNPPSAIQKAVISLLLAGRVGLRVEELCDRWNNEDGASTLTHFKRRSEVWFRCAPAGTRERVRPAEVVDRGVDLHCCRCDKVERSRLARNDLYVARLPTQQAITDEARWQRHNPTTVGAVLLILDVNVKGQPCASREERVGLMSAADADTLSARSGPRQKPEAKSEGKSSSPGRLAPPRLPSSNDDASPAVSATAISAVNVFLFA